VLKPDIVQLEKGAEKDLGRDSRDKPDVKFCRGRKERGARSLSPEARTPEESFLSPKKATKKPKELVPCRGWSAFYLLNGGNTARKEGREDNPQPNSGEQMVAVLHSSAGGKKGRETKQLVCPP